jgi:hypothetical protein
LLTGASPQPQQLLQTLSEPSPIVEIRHFSRTFPFWKCIRSPTFIQLGESEQRLHPRTLTRFQGRADQSRGQIYLSPMQNNSLDLDDRANGNKALAF